MAASIAVMSTTTTNVADPSQNDSSSTTTAAAESSSSSSLNISVQTLTEDVNNVNNGNVEMMDELQEEQQQQSAVITISGTFNSDDSNSSSTTVRALMFAKSTHAFFSFPPCLLCLLEQHTMARAHCSSSALECYIIPITNNDVNIPSCDSNFERKDSLLILS